MKKQFIIILVLIVCQCIPPSNAEEGAVLNVDDIIKNVDPDMVTKAEFKEYFKTIEGKKAKGKGKVVNILPGGRYLCRIATSKIEIENQKIRNQFCFNVFR